MQHSDLIDLRQSPSGDMVRSYRPLWILLCVALLPLLFALVSYFGAIAVPEQRVNEGQLVVDQHTGFELISPDGETFNNQDRWQLLLVVTRCAADCEQWLQQMRQLHTLLGRDRGRVDYQLVLPPKDVSSAQISKGLTPPRTPIFSEQATADNQGLWLLDPLDNSVLRYRLDQPAKSILKDLKRLLKVSRIG